MSDGYVCWGSGPKNAYAIISDQASQEDLWSGFYHASQEAEVFANLWERLVNKEAYRTALYKGGEPSQEWLKFLHEEIADVAPTYIVAAGPEVFSLLTGKEGKFFPGQRGHLPSGTGVSFIPFPNVFSERDVNLTWAALDGLRVRQDGYPPAKDPIIHLDEVPDLQGVPVIYVDCEGSAKFRWSIQITLITQPNRAYIIRDKVLAETFRRRLAYFKPMTYFHNALYDLKVLREAWGIDLDRLGVRIGDTMHLSQYIGGAQGLKKAASMYLNMDMDEYTDLFAPEMATARRLEANSGDLFTKWDGIPTNWATVIRFAPESKWLPYAAADTIATCGYHEFLRKEMGFDERQEFIALDYACLPVLSTMESNGFTFDRHTFDHALNALNATKMEQAKRLYQMGAESLDPEGLRSFLYDVCKVPKGRFTKKGLDSTEGPYLRKFRDIPGVKETLAYKATEKLVSTFFEPVPGFVDDDGRLKPRWRHTIIPSGRLACEDPNLLAWPVRAETSKVARSYLTARPGCQLGSWDLDQIEIRLMASMSKDEKLTDIFLSGKDFHSETAVALLGATLDERGRAPEHLRTPAKTINYMVGYQGGAYKLIDLLEEQGITEYTVEQGERLLEDWWETYSGVEQFMDEAWEQAKTSGYVYAADGRPRLLPWAVIKGKGLLWKQHMGAKRKAGNHVIQEEAARVIKRAMVRIHHRFRDTDFRLILQVHDELIAEFPEGKFEEVNAIMVEELTRDSDRYTIPITCSGKFGFRWSEIH